MNSKKYGTRNVDIERFWVKSFDIHNLENTDYSDIDSSRRSRDKSNEVSCVNNLCEQKDEMEMGGLSSCDLSGNSENSYDSESDEDLI